MNTDSSRIVPLAGSVLAIAAIAVPMWLRTTPVDTPKGPDSKVAQVTLDVEETVLERVPALLWEDPFEAIGVASRQAGDDARSRAGDTPRSAGRKAATGECGNALDVDIGCLNARIRLFLERGQDSRSNAQIRLDCDFGEEAALRALNGRVRKPKCQPDAPSASQFRLLLVPVNEGRSFDAVESRRQVRVALQTAMLSRDWTAERESHIGWLAWSAGEGAAFVNPDGTCNANALTPRSGQGGSGPRRVSVPFELFRHATGAGAMVLWLEEGQFATAARLRALAAALTCQPSGHGAVDGAVSLGDFVSPHSRLCVPGSACGNGVVAAVIGPTGTGGLIRMLGERLEPTGSGPTARAEVWEVSRRPWARLYSPVSTVDESAIFDVPALTWQRMLKSAEGKKAAVTRGRRDVPEEVPNPCPPHPETRLQCEMSRRGFVFVRAVARDDVTMRAVLAEIERRRRATHPHDCAILLISEGDSLYSRTLARHIDQELERMRTGESSCRLLQVPGREAAGAYQYLKSINDPLAQDAIQELEKQLHGQTGPAAGPTLPAASVAPGDAVSEGNQQFDYVRRLVRRMVVDAGAGQYDAEGVFAVGVFGTDPHDKISILKLLRPAFPGARFFTTDMDAILFDVQHRLSTRNLIVASAEGLDVGRGARGMPPFRRMRQTSYAHAFIAAVDQAETVDLSAPPRLYEIGLKGPVELTVPGPVCTSGSLLADRIGKVPAIQVFGAALAVLALCAWIAWYVRRGLTRVMLGFLDAAAWRRSPRECSFERAGVLARGALIAVATTATLVWWGLALFAFVESCHGNGEPTRLLDGVSLWLPALIRGFAVTVGVVAFFHFLSRVRGDARAAGKAHCLFPASGSAPGQRWRDLWLDYFGLGLLPRSRAVPPTGANAAGTCPPKRAHWFAYQRHTCLNSVAAVGFGVLLFLFYQGLLLFLDDPNMPSRGQAMASLSRFSLALAGIVAFTLAMAAWLQSAAVRRFVVGVMPTPPATPCPPGDACPASNAAPPAPDLTTLHDRSCIDHALRETGFAEDREPTEDERWLADRILTLELLQDIARPVQNYVYLPLVMASLLMVARWRLFADQTFPVVLGLALVSLIAICLWNAWRLTSTARAARAQLRTVLERRLPRSAAGLPDAGQARDERLLHTFVARVDALSGGIYAPLLSQPFFRALFIPLGTGSVLEWLALSNGLG